MFFVMRNGKHFEQNYPLNVNKTISYKPNYLLFLGKKKKHKTKQNKKFSYFVSQACAPADTSVTAYQWKTVCLLVHLSKL